MNLLEAFYYGIIQGLAEFIPVSSSAHLALLPHVLGLNVEPGVYFDLSLHGGTALATLVYFRQEIKSLLGEFPHIFSKSPSPQGLFLLHLIVATMASGCAIFFLEGPSVTYGRIPSLIAFNLVFFALIMLIADRKSSLSKREKGRSLSVPWAILLGFSQSLAIFPGVSRAGIVLSVGLLLGLPRKESIQFAFFLSIPLILGGIAMRWKEVTLVPFGPVSCLMGVTLSFVVGLVAIHFFLKVFHSLGLWPFCLYRILLAGAVIFFIK